MLPSASYIDVPSDAHASATSGVSRCMFVSMLLSAVPASAPAMPFSDSTASAAFTSPSEMPICAAVGPMFVNAAARSDTSEMLLSAAATKLLAMSTASSASSPNVAIAMATACDALARSRSDAAARSMLARSAPVRSEPVSRYVFRSPKMSVVVMPAL